MLLCIEQNKRTNKETNPNPSQLMYDTPRGQKNPAPSVVSIARPEQANVHFDSAKNKHLGLFIWTGVQPVLPVVKDKGKNYTFTSSIYPWNKRVCVPASLYFSLTAKHIRLWRQRQIPRRQSHQQEPRAKPCKPAGSELERGRTRQKNILSK